MKLELCEEVEWSNLTLRAKCELPYCYKVWHDGINIHICADYTTHSGTHRCYCTEECETGE